VTIFIFTRPKVGGGGIFAPTLSHVINKTRAVGSGVDGSDQPQVLFHAGPTICLGGTHVRDPHGFVRYSYGTHTFLFCGTHNFIVGFMIKNLC
jgi:hypothetical protein